MDLATLLGLIGAIGIVLAAILTGGEVGMFINAPSILVVFGGTIGAVIMKFTLGQFLDAFKGPMRGFIFKLDKPEDLIEQSVERSRRACMIQIEIQGAAIVVRNCEKGSFPWGAACFTVAFAPVLSKLRNALDNVNGIIAVAGYTDDIPIKTTLYRSNWDLSSARVVSVLHALLEDGELSPPPFVVEGHGEAHPLVPNDTAENRAQNRRVEITIHQDHGDLSSVEEAMSDLDSDVSVEVIPTDTAGGNELPEPMVYPIDRIEKIRQGFDPKVGGEVNDGKSRVQLAVWRRGRWIKEVAKMTTERRRYYRIEDRALIKYRVISDGMLDDERRFIFLSELKVENVCAALMGIDIRLQKVIGVLQQKNRPVAEALDLINRTLMLLERVVALEAGPASSGHRGHELSWSA